MEKTLETVVQRMQSNIVPPRILLSKFRFLDDDSRKSLEFADPNHIPFWYYFGKEFPVESMMEYGFGLGLMSGCYLIGSPDTKQLFGIQPPSKAYYSTRMGKHNIKSVWKGDFSVDIGHFHSVNYWRKDWNLIAVTHKPKVGELSSLLNTFWEVLADGGLLCLDHVGSNTGLKQVLTDFTISRRRKAFVLPTRNRICIVQK